MNTIDKLQSWYLSHCNGDWEHSSGVSIGTLDNPGWTIDIDLENTNLQTTNFKEISFGVGDNAQTSGNDWMVCKVEDKIFKARGGPLKLEEMLRIFLQWAEDNSEQVDAAKPHPRGAGSAS